MTFSSWLLYVVAVFILTVTPGPSVLMCIATSVNAGPRRALVAALGSTSAITGLMALSALGLGSVLAASETLFGALKWLGAAYLAWLGVTLWRSQDASIGEGRVAAAGSHRRTYARGFMVGASNPKALLFFGALFPQFIDPAAPQGPQFLILGTTFVCFELGWLTVYALTAARARRWLQQPRRGRQFNRAAGTVFLVAAGLLATSRRAGS
jgi:threonine/homoserine/homoserine lactone efflux protein